MPIGPGSVIGSYEIVSLLGEGGMGVVFRARDTRLRRDVAVKVLPDHLARDPDRLSRFRREATILASLNHTNIAQIYGLESSDESDCLVMELVEGDTLAERLERPMPLDEALRVLRQIVDGLEAAHEHGVVHRDLKPANIKLTPDGRVKILDFGLAKMLEHDVPNAATMTVSSPGVVVGTAAYMSPEQAKGQPVGARTDIWAVGCILYEALTARRAFTGETAVDVTARIVSGEPDWAALPATTPAIVRSLLTAMLAKDQRKRPQHIGDVRLFLDPSLVRADLPAASGAPLASERRRRGTIAAGLLLTLLAMGLGFGVSLFGRRPAEPALMRMQIPLPDLFDDEFLISPDGRRIAYIGPVPEEPGTRAVWVRSIDSEVSEPLQGTFRASTVFWSPDSLHIGFVADGRLFESEASGGPSQARGQWSKELRLLGATTNADGVVIAGQHAGPILRVDGGLSAPLTILDGSADEVAHTWPQFLPDGRRFIFMSRTARGEAALHSGTIGSNTTTRISPMALDSRPVYAEPGYLLYTEAGELTAQRFDTDRLKLEGSAISLATGVRAGAVSVSSTGVLLYRKAIDATGNTQLVWYDRTGKPGAVVGAPANYGGVQLDPDGRRVAVDINANDNSDVWVIDLARGVRTPITTDPKRDWGPFWSSDGSRLLFNSFRSGVSRIYQRAADGMGKDELLPGDPSAAVGTNWSKDNRYVVFSRAKDQLFRKQSRYDIWRLALTGSREEAPFLVSQFDKIHSRLSPDAHWIAYSTNETGMYQIVVRTFPDPDGGVTTITSDGGVEPKWSRDGRELYYVALDGQMMFVPVQPGKPFKAGPPVPLFQTPLKINRDAPAVGRRYDVSADGQRFLMIAPAATANASSITVVVNWVLALAER